MHPQYEDGEGKPLKGSHAPLPFQTQAMLKKAKENKKKKRKHTAMMSDIVEDLTDEQKAEEEAKISGTSVQKTIRSGGATMEEERPRSLHKW